MTRSLSRRGAVLGAVLTALLAALLTAAPARPAEAAGPVPGTVAKPIGRVHLESFEYFNILQVVDAANRIIRTIPVAGNPGISKPEMCLTQERIRVNWDVTLTWQLNYFTRMCPGRGIGTHDIPINRYDGRRSMDAADLGKRPGYGAPLSHGCLRMREADAKYVYDNFSGGYPVYFITTPWRAIAPRPPSAPTGVAARPGDRQATVSWRHSAVTDAAVSSYVVTISPGGRQFTVAPSATSLAVTGLVNGTAYSFRVHATSAAGASPPSAWSTAVVPFGRPGAPGQPTTEVLPPDGLLVRWTPAAANGAGVSGYVVTVGDRTERVAPTPGVLLVRDLPTDVPLRVTVAAVNAAGSGPAVTVDLPRLG